MNTVSLKKVLEAILDPKQSKQYLRSTSSEILPARYYYNIALRDLSIKDSESAIYNLILALDTDPNHEPSLHLAKTMFFGLSKIFYEQGGEFFKQKHPNISYYINELENKINLCETNIIKIRNELYKINTNKGIFSIFMFFKKNKINKLDKDLKFNINKKEELKKELKFAIKILQIEEYSKILSLILEICLYPIKYSWIEQKNLINEQNINIQTKYKQKSWYG